MTCSCVGVSKVKYLTAAEIQESIVGKSLKEAEPGFWKEEYLPIDDERLRGEIRGRSKSTIPYGGAWSIVGNRVCVVYRGSPEANGSRRLAKGRRNRILWFDESGRLDSESELVEMGEVEVSALKTFGPMFRQETVMFQHGEEVLVGNLRLPAGYAPYPAVVFVHGSGPATRHSYLLELIGNEFLSRGFATLIWSKPGVDGSTGDYLKQSMAVRAEEVAAAMSHLAERGDIDGERIGLWGASQAGWVMPLVPVHRDVAFVIVVSGSGQTGQEQHMYLSNNELARIGISQVDRADVLESRRALYDLMRESVDYEDFLPRYKEWLAEMKQRSWYPTVESKLDRLVSQRFILSTGPEEFEQFSINLADDANRTLIPAPLLKNFSMPVLAIYGTRDSVVDSQLGSKAYEEIPLVAGNFDVTVKRFEGADDGILQPDNDGYLYFAPGLIATMGDWLAARR